MDTDTIHYFWNRVWWGLETKQTLLDYFRNYGGTITPENELEEIYRTLQKRKKEIIAVSEVDKTQVQKLYEAFLQLNHYGIMAVHYAGSSVSDGRNRISELFESVVEKAAEYKPGFDTDSLKGYCFYHEQDIEDFVPDREDGIIPESYFYLVHGAFENDGKIATQVAEKTVQALKNAGLDAEWDGDPITRIKLNDFYWINESENRRDWTGLAPEQILGGNYRHQNTRSEIPVIGEQITFIKGRFNKVNGTVKAVDTVNKTTLIELNLFGKLVPVEMSFDEFKDTTKN